MGCTACISETDRRLCERMRSHRRAYEDCPTYSIGMIRDGRLTSVAPLNYIESVQIFTQSVIEMSQVS